MPVAPISILFAIPSMDRDGPDRVMFELLSGLDRARFVPTVVVTRPTGHYLSRLPRDVAVEVISEAAAWAPRYPVAGALRVVRRLAPDVVFATQRMNLTMGMASPGFPPRTRLVLRQANDVGADASMLRRQAPLKQRLAHLALMAAMRRADAVVCQSEAMRADLRRRLGARAVLHAIDNPVDVDAALREAGTEEVTLPGAPALISVGRLSAQKGFDLLLPAFAEVRTAHPGAHLTVLGDGPDRAALEAQAAALGLASSVTFAGFSTRVLPSVRAAALFVLASRYEGFPNAALEALACGTPVVLTDCPGANATIVRPGLNGRLAAQASSAAMAAALGEALAELPRYHRDVITADTRARYDAAQIVARYQAVFVAATQRGAR
ncbi:MAG: glycosyltransferase [Kofleriaceae bacterium]